MEDFFTWQRRNMSRQYESSEALCPFYKMEEGSQIWCDGPNECTHITLSFREHPDAVKHKKHFCRCFWTKCPLAVMNWSLYEDTVYLMNFREPKKNEHFAK